MPATTQPQTQQQKDESVERERRLLAETAARRRHQQQQAQQQSTSSNTNNTTNTNNTYTVPTTPLRPLTTTTNNKHQPIDLTHDSPPHRQPHNSQTLLDEQYARELQDQLDRDEALARQLQSEDDIPAARTDNVHDTQLIGDDNVFEDDLQYPPLTHAYDTRSNSIPSRRNTRSNSNIPVGRAITETEARNQELRNFMQQLSMLSDARLQYQNPYNDGGLFGGRPQYYSSSSTGSGGILGGLGSIFGSLFGRPSMTPGGGPMVRLSSGRTIDLYNVPQNLTYDELNELQSIVGHVKPPVKAATHSDLQRLPSFKYKAKNKTTPNAISATDDENICNICFDSFNDGDELRSLPCFHRFHKAEIDKWLLTNEKCPVCLTPVSGATEGAET